MASGARFTAVKISKHPKRLACLCLLILLSVIPAIGLVIVLSLGIRQLQSEPQMLSWNEMLGEHVARWVAPYARDTQFQMGIPADIQVEYLPIALAIIGLTHALSKGLIEYIVEWLSHDVAHEVRNQIMSAHFTKPYQQSRTTEGALLASLVGPNAHELQLGVRRVAGLVPMNLLQSVVLLAWLIVLDTKLFALFITVLLPAGITIRVLGRTLKKLAKQGLQYETEVLGLFSERLSGWETIRVFGTLRIELIRFANKNLELYKRLRRSARASSLGAPTVEWLATVAGAFVVLIALRRLAIGELSSAVLTGFLVTIGHLSGSLQSLTRHFNSLKRSRAACDRIATFLDESSGSINHDLNHSNTQDSAENFQIEEIKIENLAAFEEGSQFLLFEGLSFSAKKGDFLAIMGPSGCGKSTLLRCLLGLEKAACGDIQVNGRPLSKEQWARYSSDLAFIAQEPFVLHGNLLENILFPRELLSENSLTSLNSFTKIPAHIIKDVNNCLERSQLSKPWETIASELSGGEKQRLMLARAFYRKATLWVLDEATSALDKQTEESFLRVLQAAKSDLIVIFVTHRESVANFATTCIPLSEYKAKTERIKK